MIVLWRDKNIIQGDAKVVILYKINGIILASFDRGVEF